MPKFSAYMKGGDGSVGPPGASMISGVVSTTTQLPVNPPDNRRIYLVGESDPKRIYAYIENEGWVDQGLTASEIGRVTSSINSIPWTSTAVPSITTQFSTSNQIDYLNFDFTVVDGRSAGFSTSQGATAVTTNWNNSPNVTITTEGNDWEKKFNFGFTIPVGRPAGFGDVHVTTKSTPSGSEPWVSISTIDESPEYAKEFSFAFGIPEGVAAGFSTGQYVSVSTLDSGELATVEITTITTSPETAKEYSFHFGLPRGDALSIYEGVSFTTGDGYEYHWVDTNGTSTLVFNRGTVEKLPIYIYNNNNESIASTFKISTSTIEYEADEKFNGTMYLMMPATLQNVEIGSVTSVDYGNNPSVSISTGSTSTNIILDFTIPVGYPGRTAIDSITTNIQSLSTNLNSVSTALHGKALHITMPSTSSLGTINNSNITTTMRVVNIVWGTPANVTGNVTWNTDTAGQLVLSGTLSGATTAEIDLIDFG